jgi:hypothetical protein
MKINLDVHKGDLSMKKRFLLGAFILCISLVMLFGTVVAQNPRTGTSAASELLIPVGARDFAMAGSTYASVSGVEAIYWNPAGLSRLPGSAEGMFSSMTWLADIKVTYGVAAATFGSFGTIGLSVKSLDFGDIPLTTVDDPENRSGATFSPGFMTLGLTYSRLITDAVSAGVTAKLISETIPLASSTGVAFDLGLQYHGLFDVKGLDLGVDVKNIGPEMTWGGSGLLRSATSSEGNRPEQRYALVAAGFELPSMIDIGLSYVGKSDILLYSVSGSYTSNNLYVDEYKVGAEVGFALGQLSLFARGGYIFYPQIEQSSDKIFGPSAGFGITYQMETTSITADYGYRSVDLFAGNNVFSVKIGF